MKSYVPDLVKLLKPIKPERPCDWHTIEAELGLKVPDDFKEFWTAFGPGIFGFRDSDPTFFVVHSPYFKPGYARFPDCIPVMAERRRRFRTEIPDSDSYAIWPENNGLLGFAHDTSGNEYYFVTADDPCFWSVQMLGRHQADQQWGFNFSRFLWEFAHDRIQVVSGRLPNDGSKAIWTPYTVRKEEN